MGGLTKTELWDALAKEREKSSDLELALHHASEDLENSKFPEETLLFISSTRAGFVVGTGGDCITTLNSVAETVSLVEAVLSRCANESP